jgi:hypothetical protein
MRHLAIASAVVVALLAAGSTAAASDQTCLSVPVPPPSKPPQAIRFGITPLPAGTSGVGQEQPAPEDQAQADLALRTLHPPGHELVMRINRVFESDGQAGIDRAMSLEQHYSQLGFEVESQVRYHPTDAENGDMNAWVQYVRQATAALAQNPSLVALTITNEVNFPVSPNTSDGAYKDALKALVLGIVTARQELDQLGRKDVALGFSYAYRYLPSSDANFWKGIAEQATPAFRRALDYVGVQLYPGLVYPPALPPGQTAGDATLDALALVRNCYMPLARLGNHVKLWITENGYATNLGHSETEQEQDLNSTLDDVYRYSGTFGVSDYRYFNLRDNVPNGADLFDDVGLLRSEYTQKPAFFAYRDRVAQYGTAAP